MNRRQFIKAIAKGVLAGVIAPAALFKAAPEVAKTLYAWDHTVEVWGDAFLTPNMIANEALRMLKNDLVLSRMVRKDYLGAIKRKGDTITIRRPNKFKID